MIKPYYEADGITQAKLIEECAEALAYEMEIRHIFAITEEEALVIIQKVIDKHFPQKQEIVQ
jgi:hypothetical protein